MRVCREAAPGALTAAKFCVDITPDDPKKMLGQRLKTQIDALAAASEQGKHTVKIFWYAFPCSCK